jgi:hypothetical protein
MTNDHSTKTAALALLAAGEATLSEAAELAGASRQLVRHWARREGIDPAATRAAWLKSAWRKRLQKRKR